jgi:hypothetical protein
VVGAPDPLSLFDSGSENFIVIIARRRLEHNGRA